MDRDLIEEVHAYLSKIEKPSEHEQYLLRSVESRLPYFPITTVSRADLESRGFDTSKVSDSDMVSLADGMAGGYVAEVYWIDLDIIAEGLDIPKYLCPKCGGDASGCDMDSKCTCSSCDHEWTSTEPTGRYVLVESLEETSFFNNNDIGYCCGITDDFAMYIPEHLYIAHFEKDPNPDKLMIPVRHPESQQYLELEHSSPSEFKQCERIQESEEIEAFGKDAIWVPLSIIKTN